MNKGNWVPMDKGLIKTLGNLNRPYSIVEAMFCHQYNVDCGKEFTYRGYAKLWQWSVGKVKRFIEGLQNTSGTVVEQKGNGSGTLVRFVTNDLELLAEQKQNTSGTVVEQKRVANINPNTKPNPNKETDTPFQAVDFLTSQGIEKKLAIEYLKVRKGKRLAPTETALSAILKKIKSSGITPNEGIKICVEKSWGGFEPDWIKNGKSADRKQEALDRTEKIIAELRAGIK